MKAAAFACMSLLGVLGMCAEGKKIPIVYSTDLFHPHEDPDDHYDLATLFALEEFDIKGVILDLGEQQKRRTGRPAVEQLMHVTGRRVPTAIGLAKPLKARDDKALDQPEEFQGAVRLILDTLRESSEKAVIFSTGSCRDVAAAFNREPDLFRQKVKAYYPNVGDGPGGPQGEYNVALDVRAYERVFDMGAPINWCPCYGKDAYATFYVVDQPFIIGACTQPVQNFFVYCLTKSKEDPIRFLASGAQPMPRGPRRMWCTAPLLHAAGRKVYQRGDGDFLALQPDEAAKAGLGDKAVEPYAFVPIHIAVAEPKPAEPLKDKAAPRGRTTLAFELDPKEPNCSVFRATDKRYAQIIGSCLKNLLAGLGKLTRRPG